MRRTAIFADEVLLNEMKDVARHEHRSVSDVLRDAMELSLKTKQGKRRLSLIGVVESGREDLAANHEEMLWPKQG